MSFAAKALFQGALTTTLTTVLYTNPGSVTTVVKDILITNTGASSRAVTIALRGSGVAKQIFAGVVISAGETIHWEGHQVLLTTETITGGQAVGTDVTVTIAGVEG